MLNFLSLLVISSTIHSLKPLFPALVRATKIDTQLFIKRNITW